MGLCGSEAAGAGVNTLLSEQVGFVFDPEDLDVFATSDYPYNTIHRQVGQ